MNIHRKEIKNDKDEDIVCVHACVCVCVSVCVCVCVSVSVTNIFFCIDVISFIRITEGSDEYSL